MANYFPAFAGLLSGANPDEETPFGVPASDVRMAQAGLLGNIGATLLAAGQRISPADRARLLAQIGPQTAQFSTDIYNAAQRRYQQGMLQEAQRKQALAEQQAAAEEDRRAAEAERKAGEPARIAGAFDLATAMGTPTYRATEYGEGGAPTQWAEVAPASSPQQQLAVLLRAGVPSAAAVEFLKAGAPPEKKEPAISDSEARSIIAQGMRDPSLASDPRYHQAFDALYGTKLQTIRDELGNVSLYPMTPPVPQGVPRPTFENLPGQTPQATAAQTLTEQAQSPQPQQTPRIVEAPVTQEQRGRADSISTIGTSIAALASELNSLSGVQGVLPGEAKTKIQSGVNAIRLQLKEAYKLGALSGSDYDALDALLKDPTTFGSVIMGGPASARARALTQLQEILNQISSSAARLPQSVRPELPTLQSPEQSKALNNYYNAINQ